MHAPRTAAIAPFNLSQAPRAQRPLWQRLVAGLLIVTLQLTPLKVTIDQTLALQLGWHNAAAAPVADPYAPIGFRPTLTQTSAGVPVVNITAPNANGISHNQYRAFDVDALGLILNNSLAAGGTLLGGSVAANPNLSGRTATLIVNEVTSSGSAFASRIDGAIEVFGAPARVVIANPNGITCAGCAFVNTPRITLTTGTVQFVGAPGGAPSAFDSAGALAFDVRGGRVHIAGNGIEGTVGRIDVVAETIGVSAPLRANLGAADAGQINLVAGRQRVAEGADGNYALSTNGAANTASAIQSANPSEASVQAGYAIDAAALGAMTAGQIKLIATPAGLGVRAGGALAASAGDLVITSNGEVRVGNASAKRDVVIEASGDAHSGATLFAERDVRLRAGGALQGSGAVSAGGGLALQAGGDATLGGALDIVGDAQLTVGGQLVHGGNANIGGSYTARAGSMALTGNTQVEGDLALDAQGAVHYGSLTTRGGLRLNAAGDILGEGDARAAGAVAMTSTQGSIEARGDLAAGAALAVVAANDLRIAGATTAVGALSVQGRDGDAALGQLSTNRTLSVRAGRDLRAGAVTAGEDTVLNAGRDARLDADLAAGGALDITSGSLLARGLSAQGNADVRTSAGELTIGGDATAGGSLALTAAGSLNIAGSTLANGATRMSAQGSVGLGGEAASGSAIEIEAQQDIATSGLSALGAIRVASNAGGITLGGKLIGGGEANVRAATHLHAREEVSTLGGLTLDAGSGALRADGAMSAGADATLGAGTHLHLFGPLSAIGNARVSAGGDLLAAGQVSASELTLSAGGALDAQQRLAATAGMTLTGQDIRTQGALAGGALSAAATRDLTLAGETLAKSTMTLTAAANLANSGQASAGGTLTLGAATLTNSGAVLGASDATLNAGSLINRGTLYSRNLNASATTLDNAGGTLLAGEDLTLSLTNLASNALGIIGAKRDVRVSASGAFDNTGGSISALRDLSLSLPNASFDPSAGEIGAGNLLGIDARALDIRGDWSPNAKSLALTIQSDFANTATIAMAGDFRLITAGNVSNSGVIASGGGITLSGAQITNTHKLLANADIALNGNVVNRGSIAALGDVAIAGASFDNAGAHVQADKDLRIAVSGTLDNRGGSLLALGNAQLQAGAIDNDRAAPVGGTTVTHSFNRALLDQLVLYPARTITETYECGGGDAGSQTCTREVQVPATTLADLQPDYTSNTLAVSVAEPALLPWQPPRMRTTTIALPQTVRTDIQQSHGQAALIHAGGELTLVASGTLSSRGSAISAGGNLALQATMLEHGRSSTLTNGATEAVNAADLARFVAELNSARGAGSLTATCDGNGACTDTVVPSYEIHPLSVGAPSITPGLASSTQAAGNATLNVGTVDNEGTLLTAGNFTLAGAGALVNAGRVLAGGNLAIANVAIDNRVGAQLLAGADMTLSTGTLTNTAATIQSGRDLTIRAGSLTNQGAAPSVRVSTYFVDSGAGYQTDKWATLGAYLADLPNLVADEVARAKLTTPERSADRVDYRGSHRLRLYGPSEFYLDSGLEHVRFTFTRSAYEQPAVLSAGRNLDIAASGAIDNAASLINAGAAATIRAASLANSAAQNTYDLYIKAGEWSRYTVYSPAAATLQAGTSLSVEVGGSVVNTGNVLGTQIAVSGGEITNGITSTIPTIGATLPAAVIPLLPPGLGAANDARGALTGALGQGIPTGSAPGSAPTLGSLGTPGNGNPAHSDAASVPHIDGAAVRLGDYGRWGTPSISGETVQAPSASTIALRYLKSAPGTQALAPLTPEYLVSLLPEPLVKGTHLFFYADPFLEAQLLQQAALREVGQAYFVNGLAYDDQHHVSIDTQQRAILYENAAAFAQDNGLRLGQALSPALQAKLDRPLLWYVEQEVPDGSGARALVPTVYLPALYRQSHLNVAGGLIRGEQVSLSAAGTLTNTGSIVAANTLSIDARQFINAKRQADIGKRWQGIEGGWIDITGTRAVEDGAFIAAANLQLNAQRIESISGEFQILGANAAETQAKSAAYLDQLRTRLGASFVESTAQDNLHYEVHQEQGFGLEQIAIIAVGIAVAIYTGGAASGWIGSTFGTSAGSTFAAASATSAAGLGNVMASAAIGSMASSAVTGALSGNFDFANVLKSGLTAGLTAGLTQGLGLDKLDGLHSGATGALAGGAGVADWGTKAFGWAARAGVSAAVDAAINGSSFGDAFLNGLVANASASAASWIGDAALLGQTSGGAEGLSEIGRIGAHALVGCAAQTAKGGDCASGAIGAASSAIAANFLPGDLDPTDTLTRALTTAGLAFAGGAVAQFAGRNGSAGFDAARNEVQNNWLMHAEAQRRAELEQQRRSCTTDACRQQAQWQIDALNRRDSWRDEQTRIACEAPGSQSCGAWNAALQAAAASYRNLDPKADLSGSIAAERHQVNRDAFLYGQRVRDPFLYGVGKGLLKLSPPGALVGTGMGAVGLVSAIIDNGVGETAVAIARGVANLPATMKAGLESSDPTVRGEALVDALALASVATAVSSKLGRVSGLKNELGDSAVAPMTEKEIQKIIDEARIHNFRNRDGMPWEFPQQLVSQTGTVIRANPDKTTTVLGSFRSDMKLIINDHLDAPRSIVDTGPPRPGSINVLNVPDEMAARLGPERFWNEVNKPFLDAAIARGDDIVLATKPEPRYLVRTDGKPTGFGEEIDYLRTRGYDYDSVSGLMKRVKEKR